MKKYLGVYCLHLTAYCLLSFAQTPDTLWTKTYGGLQSDHGYSVQQTIDSGYIFVGNTNSFIDTFLGDVYLVKTDKNGYMIWGKNYGGGHVDRGRSIALTSDSGYIIVGYTLSFGAGDADVYLIKTDANGNLSWQRTYGGINSDGGRSVEQTSDGGYIVVGWTALSSGGIWLIKTDADGDTLWTRIYRKYVNGLNYAESVQQTEDGGYIIAGSVAPMGENNDVYIMKTDSLGDTLWTRTYGGTDSDGAGSVRQTPDGRYIIAGYTRSFGAGLSDVYLIKTDTDGDTLWTRTYGGTRNDAAHSIQLTSDSGYIITGFKDSYDAGPAGDVYLIKTDANGDTLWTKTCGGDNDDVGNSVQQTIDGGYIVAGWTYSFGAGDVDFYLIRLESESGIEEQQSLNPPLANLEVFPNPFSKLTNISFGEAQGAKGKGQRTKSIELKIYDSSGRVVKDFSSTTPYALRTTLSWNGTDNFGRKLPGGVYFIRLNTDNHTDIKKVIFIK